METLKKIKKRILPLVLAVVISATSIVSGPASLTARAASFAVTSDLTVEFVMLLYNIFETISIASGMKEGLDDYSKGMSIFDAFISFLDGLSYDPFEEFTIYGPDGTAMTREEFDAIWESAVGAGKLKVRPNEGEFAKYRVLTGGAAPTPSPDPSSSPDPDDKYVNPFTDLQGMFVGANLVAAGADFLSSVQNNAVPEVDPAKYYGTAGLFTGELEKDSDGNFLVSGFTTSTNGSTFYKYVYSSSYSYPVVAYMSSGTAAPFLGYRGDDSYIKVGVFYEQYKNGSLHNRGTNYGFDISGTYSFNIPLFDSYEHACFYLKNKDDSGLLNGVPYDYHSMTAAAPDTLENLSGTKLDPAKVPAMNNAMKEAANGVEATGTDKEANNAEMIAAVKAAVAEALAEAQPDPAPEPTAAPDPEPSTAPDPDAGTGTYSGILGLILSAIQAIASQIWDYFSHPFGSIIEGITNIVELLPKVNVLVQALPASIFGFFQAPLDLITSGITNLYNGVLRIIELLPEQVQLVLGNIVSLPSAMLQAFADPLGAIQSLLGALPSWTNLQGYLDKILNALLDPGSVLQPSGPGGEDPGGDGSGGGSKFNLLSLLNGLIYLILILILLLKIFIHCLQFIINIFKIEASPGFLPDEMVMGLNFLKQIEITGIGLSVYDFMMGLVYILMFFGVVKLLRGYAYKIRIPSGGGK